MAHLARNPLRSALWIDHLFSSHGSGLHVRDAIHYLPPITTAATDTTTTNLDFWDLMAICAPRREIPIAYLREGERKWRFNPPKGTLLPLGLGDRVAVLQPALKRNLGDSNQ